VILLALPAAYAADSGQQYSLEAKPVDLVGEDSLRFFEGSIDPDADVKWQLYVPSTYNPAQPAGLMVYVSPTRSGTIPPLWKAVMADKNMIWIAADRSGNSVKSARRASFSILATVLAKREYTIDPERIYVSGFSGGGRVASLIAPQVARTFRGAIYICGVDFWGDKAPPLMEQAKTNRYVFVTGSEDFNRRETRRLFGAYKKAGMENIKLIDIAHMGHSNPDARNFAAAIDYLDGVEDTE
jgi:predicted peptidase